MSAEREQLLDEVLAGYLRNVRGAYAPSRRHLLEMYPQLAEDLSDFFDNQDHFQRLAAPLRRSMPQDGLFPLSCKTAILAY